MSLIDMLLVGVGLSMDAFAVSICKGLASREVVWSRALLVALFFGGFQALMPALGWLLGTSVQSVIEPFDHWVAFVLLAAIGGKMIWDAFHDDGACEPYRPAWGAFFAELVVLSVATSIDALAAGVSFAVADIDIVAAVCVIGLTTFSLSLFGTVMGSRLGARFERAATLAGGAALVLLGLKILLEHLGAA